MKEFVVTTAIKKLLRMKKRKRVVQGGTSAGKTFGIIPILIDRAIKTPHLEVSIVSESIPHLRRGAMKDFLKIMIITGRYQSAQWNKSSLKYTFTNGAYIEFFSVDQEDKLRGARRNVLYVNEANNVAFEAYNQLAIRTDQEIWIDFNPTSSFWAHTEVAPGADADFIILTYKDNEGLEQTIIDEIEIARDKAKTSTYWDNWWNVYGLGMIGSLEGACIPDWKSIPRLPSEARLLGYGMDFGYTNDPTSLIAMYKYNDGYIYDELVYETGLLNMDISKKFKQLEVNQIVYADSAEPKSIAELKYYGHTVLPVKKGKDSISHGITLLNQNKISVTARSTNLIHELQNYIWMKDKEGNKINRPIDKYNHAIDAMRYVTSSIIEDPNKGEYHFW